MDATDTAVSLSPAQRDLVRQILRETVAGAEARIFGSRATGRARPHSDLDLLLLQPPCLTLAQRAELQDRFERSELPFRVDVVEAAQLSGPMAARVAQEMRPL